MVSYLMDRGSRGFWLQKRAPVDLRPVVGSTPLRHRLGTREPFEARRRLHQALVRLEGEIRERELLAQHIKAGQRHQDVIGKATAQVAELRERVETLSKVQPATAGLQEILRQVTAIHTALPIMHKMRYSERLRPQPRCRLARRPRRSRCHHPPIRQGQSAVADVRLTGGRSSPSRQRPASAPGVQGRVDPVQHVIADNGVFPPHRIMQGVNPGVAPMTVKIMIGQG
jgi:hypothetical protein